MRRCLLLLAAAGVLSACGGESTLSVNDQEFCAEQDDGDGALDYLRDEVDDIQDRDGYWPSSGAAFAFQAGTVYESTTFVRSRRIQDEQLQGVVDGVEGALMDAQLASDEDDRMDLGVLEDLEQELTALDDFCSENG